MVPLAVRKMGRGELNRLLRIADVVSALLYAVQGSHAQIECHNCGINSRRRDLRANNPRRYEHYRNDKAGGNFKWKLQGAAILNGDRMPNVLTDEQQQWVHFAPPELINRQFSEWQGLRADVVTAVRQNPFEYTFSSPQHLLIAAEQCERRHGLRR